MAVKGTSRRRGKKSSGKRPRCRLSRRRQRGGATTPELLVRFLSGVRAEVAPGPLVSKEKVTEKPRVELLGSPYLKTLVCTDPDAPGGNAPWLHWLVTNWKGEELESQPSGELMGWAPPTPPPGSGEHRYVFRVFKQRGAISAAKPLGRAAFPLESFVSAHGLELVAEASFRVAAEP